MGIFDRTPEGARREEVRKELKKIPDNHFTDRFDSQQKEALEAELFPTKKFGERISKEKVRQAVKDLELERSETPSPSGKDHINRKIEYLQKLLENNSD